MSWLDHSSPWRKSIDLTHQILLWTLTSLGPPRTTFKVCQMFQCVKKKREMSYHYHKTTIAYFFDCFTYTLKNAGLKITQRWVKRTNPAVGLFLTQRLAEGGKSGGQKRKVLPYVYSNSAADFTRGGTKSFLSSHKQVSSQSQVLK